MGQSKMKCVKMNVKHSLILDTRTHRYFKSVVTLLFSIFKEAGMCHISVSICKGVMKLTEHYHYPTYLIQTGLCKKGVSSCSVSDTLCNLCFLRNVLIKMTLKLSQHSVAKWTNQLTTQ